MPISTTSTGFQGLNSDTQKVINYMTGKRTYKQIVGEFFGLREEAVYDDEGENVIDFINDFKDEKVLEKKGVGYRSRLGDLGVSEESFNKLFINGIPKYGREKSKGNSCEPKVIETKPTLPVNNKRVNLNPTTTGTADIQQQSKTPRKRNTNNKKKSNK